MLLENFLSELPSKGWFIRDRIRIIH